MKTIKSVLGIVVALAMVVPFVGCGGSSDSSDNGSDVPSIVGVWRVQSLSVPGLVTGGTVTINADGTASATGEAMGQTGGGSGTYTVNGNNLTVTYNGRSYNGTYSISGNTLTLTASVPIYTGLPAISITATLTRVS